LEQTACDIVSQKLISEIKVSQNGRTPQFVKQPHLAYEPRPVVGQPFLLDLFPDLAGGHAGPVLRMQTYPRFSLSLARSRAVPDSHRGKFSDFAKIHSEEGV
jgi:hypothetical protein